MKELSLNEGSLAFLLLRGDSPAKRSQPSLFTLPILTASSPHDVLPIILNLALLHPCSPLLGDSGAWFGSPSLRQQLEVLELNPLCVCPYSWMMMKEREKSLRVCLDGWKNAPSELPGGDHRSTLGASRGCFCSPGKIYVRVLG